MAKEATKSLLAVAPSFWRPKLRKHACNTVARACVGYEEAQAKQV